MLNRREVMRSGLAGGFCFAIQGCAQETQSPPIAEAGGLRIDAHAHIFNADDLPVRGFVEKVLPGDHGFPEIPDRTLKVLAKVLDKATQTAAFNLKRERGLLERGSENLWKWRRELRTEFFDNSVRLALRGDVESTDALAAAITREHEEELGISKAGQQDGDVDRVTKYLRRSRLRRYIEFTANFTGFRFDNARQLIELYGEGENSVDLFVAAMVDMDYWLNDPARSDIDDQIEVNGRIARATDGRIIPFAPFCPLRQILEQGRPLEWIKEGVADHGTVGVKLYPPMGFKPLGNEGMTRREWPDHLQNPERMHPALREKASLEEITGDKIDDLGRKLDDALKALYAFCEREGVPIMAHVAPRRGSAPGYSCRADPDGWGEVATQFPNLRINLGHFGGWSPGEKSACSDREDGQNDWSDKAAQIVHAHSSLSKEQAPASKKHATVFADLGHTEDVAARPDEFEKDLRRLLNANKGLREGLMYGSDWFMLAREKNHERYLKEYQAFFSARFGENYGAFMGGNAARFLGLFPGDEARNRLDRFYRDNRTAATWRDRLYV